MEATLQSDYRTGGDGGGGSKSKSKSKRLSVKEETTNEVENECGLINNDRTLMASDFEF
jgi:hypothetical protein